MNESPHDILSAPARVGRLDELPGTGQRGEYLRLLPKLRGLAGSDRHFATCFTSAMAGEGTTTTATQFALGAAQTGSGERVILVDGNLEHPEIHQLLSVESQPGVHEVCTDGTPLSQAIQGTELENLDVLAAGRVLSGSTGYLNSLRFQEIIRELKISYDLVVVDCPPLSSGHGGTHLPSEDALTVLVVAASETRREVIEGARHELALMGADAIGIVLNRRRFFVPGFVYRRL
jgi:capsular exopolysaccharide synthesis family protein